MAGDGIRNLFSGYEAAAVKRRIFSNTVYGILQEASEEIKKDSVEFASYQFGRIEGFYHVIDCMDTLSDESIDSMRDKIAVILEEIKTLRTDIQIFKMRSNNPIFGVISRLCELCESSEDKNKTFCAKFLGKVYGIYEASESIKNDRVSIACFDCAMSIEQKVLQHIGKT